MSPAVTGAGPQVSTHPAAPPSAEDLERWRSADRAARPDRLARLRERMAAGGRRRLLRRPPREHALPDRVRARRRRGEGRRRLGTVLRLARRGRRPRRLALHAPGARGVPGRAHRGRLQRVRDALAGAGGVARWRVREARRRRGRLRSATPPGGAWRRPRRTWSSCPPRAGSRSIARSRNRPSSSASRRRAPWPTRRSSGCSRSIRPGVTEHELALALEWEMRTSGAEALAFDVACLAGQRAALPHGSPGSRERARRRGAAVRLRRAGGGLSVGHDADAVRGRADRQGPRDLRAGGRGAGGGLRRARGGRRIRRAAASTGPWTQPRGQSSRRPATASTSGTALATASAWPRTSCRRSAGSHRRRRCRRRPSSRSSPASTLTARRASASRTSSCSTPMLGVWSG